MKKLKVKSPPPPPGDPIIGRYVQRWDSELGSDRAPRVLNDAGDTSYIDYQEKMSDLRSKLIPILREGKTKSLFYSLIHSLKLLSSIPKGKNLPGVFSTPGWSLKQLNTSLASWMALQEGIGPPFLLKLKIRQKNKTIVLTGGIFSYYEFKHPIKDRLTDERWRETILGKSHIPLPAKWLFNISQ